MADADGPALRQTAIELAHWQGTVEQRLNTMDTHFSDLNGGVADIKTDIGAIRVQSAEDMGEIRVEQGILKTKVALYGAIGGIVGAGIPSLVIALAIR